MKTPITFCRWRPGHTSLVRPQASQQATAVSLMAPSVEEALDVNISISGFVGPLCVGCAGVVPLTGGPAIVWALLSEGAGPYMLAITRKVLRVLEHYPAPQGFEAAVSRGFEQGVKWMQLLGFDKLEDEADVRPYFRGAKAALYGRGATWKV